MKLLNPLVLLFLALICFNAHAQTDTKFWFVAPDAYAGHGDAPLFFRITTYDNPTTVTISMPANSNFVPKIIRIDPNSFTTIRVDKTDVENAPADQVNDKGILIESTSGITVYYEIANVSNPDKWILKGDNALGMEFYVPSQNIWANFSNYKGNANEKVDIVATQDNTIVTIVPTVDITGHNKDVPFEVILNRGQSYSAECRDIRPNVSLAGTYITSDKPIAVTISDDSIVEKSHPHDIIGDQLIPTSQIGREYIAIKTSTVLESVNKLFVLATADDTYVLFNDNPEYVRELNRGELTHFDITDNAIYIKASKPVYAYQVSGLPNPLPSANYANELGSAILPTIECTGSNKVSLTRVFNGNFWVQILTQAKNMNTFIMYNKYEGAVNFIDNLNWIKVEGTDKGDAGEAWFSAIINMNILTGIPYTIENFKGLFHLSVLDENDPQGSSGSVSFGYLSSYGSRMHIEGATKAYVGEEIVLTTNMEMGSYKWYSGSTGDEILSTERELNVTRSDTYSVTAEVRNTGCFITEQLDVIFEIPDIHVGIDRIDGDKDFALKSQERMSVSVFPTLINAEINIITKQEAIAMFYTLTGTVALQKQVNIGANKISASSLPKGCYILKVNNDTFKVIKK